MRPDAGSTLDAVVSGSTDGPGTKRDSASVSERDGGGGLPDETGSTTV